MKPAMFAEMTHVLGAPKEWDAEKYGECSGLPVAIDRDRCAFTSCWVLEPEDLAALAAGGRIYVTIVSAAHPPISLTVRAET